MMAVVLSLLWLTAVIAIAIKFGIQLAFIQSVPLRGKGEQPTTGISIVIPARNEAGNIERCLRSILNQDYPQFEIIVVDDGSTDSTVDIAQSIATTDPRVKVIQAGPLPTGWLGKPNACWQGAQHAGQRWLCFMDCDVSLSSETALRLIALQAETAAVDFLTLFPRQVLGSFWERVIIPLGFLLVIVSFDIRRINNPKLLKDAIANGQFILVRRDVYQEVGGHGNLEVRRKIVEDVALAQVIKIAGYRIMLMRGENLVETRMYSNLASLWEGFTKNVADIFGGIPQALILATGMMAIWLIPALAILWAVFTGSTTFTTGLLMTSGVVYLAIYGTAVLLFGLPLWYALLFPLAATFGALILLNSVRAKTVGQVRWRGRDYVLTK